MEPIDIKQSKGNFFRILSQTPRSQLGVMTIKSGGDSGTEDIHPGDQIIYIIEGEADVEINKETCHVREGMALTIPEKAQHHIYNTGRTDLFFLTIYAPPAY
ncbi:cupin domain-containing protein [Patescibacteria group bacterium AH-259-L07]|nr:cupin domain-containing protein [Patescibacteria group bacterium AH-259-L07]